MAHLKMIRDKRNLFPPKCLPNSTVLERILERDGMSRALENFGRITGMQRQDAIELLRFAPVDQLDPHFVNRLLTWKDIDRGKNLFMHGAGTFNVRNVVQEFIIDCREAMLSDFTTFLSSDQFHREDYDGKESLLQLRCLGQSLGSQESHRLSFFSQSSQSVSSFDGKQGLDWNRIWQCLFSGSLRLSKTSTEYTPFWLPTVADLRLRGYFEKAISSQNSDQNQITALVVLELLRRPPTCIQQQYLMQHRDYLNDPSMIVTLVEAKMLFDESTWNKLKNNLPPPQQLISSLFELSPGFEHLSTLRNHGKFRVLRNKYHLLQVGKKLHNCLRQGTYLDEVKEKEMIFVSLDGDVPGKPVAVGRYSLRERCWKDIGTSLNTEASATYGPIFVEYETKFIRPWMKANQRTTILKNGNPHTFDQDWYFDRNLGLKDFGPHFIMHHFAIGLLAGVLVVGYPW